MTINAKHFEGVEATLRAMYFGDVRSFTDERRPAAIWSSPADSRWVRYVTWLNAIDRETRRQHIQRWVQITKATALLGELPLMHRKETLPTGHPIIQFIDALLDDVESLVSQGTVETRSTVH